MFFRLTVGVFRECSSIWVYVFFPFGFEGGMWDLTVLPSFLIFNIPPANFTTCRYKQTSESGKSFEIRHCFLQIPVISKYCLICSKRASRPCLI